MNSAQKIDVHLGEQIVLVKDLRTSTILKIIISCFVGGYNEKSDITFKFCKETNEKDSADSNCPITMKDGVARQKILAFDNFIISAVTKFRNRKGMSLEWKLPVGNTIDTSGDYYCQAIDSTQNLVIRSNNIQIRDRIYWEQSE